MQALTIRKMNVGDQSVITPSIKTPTWGSVMVEQVSISLNNGVINKTAINGFLRAPLTTLQALGLKEGMDFNLICPSKILIVDSYTPNPEYDHKPRVKSVYVNDVKTGTEPILSADGRAIFREATVVNFNDERTDVIIRTASKKKAVISEVSTFEETTGF